MGFCTRGTKKSNPKKKDIITNYSAHGNTIEEYIRRVPTSEKSSCGDSGGGLRDMRLSTSCCVGVMVVLDEELGEF